MEEGLALLYWNRSIDVHILYRSGLGNVCHPLRLCLLVLPGHELKVFDLALRTRQKIHRNARSVNQMDSSEPATFVKGLPVLVTKKPSRCWKEKGLQEALGPRYRLMLFSMTCRDIP